MYFNLVFLLVLYIIDECNLALNMHDGLEIFNKMLDKEAHDAGLYRTNFLA